MQTLDEVTVEHQTVLVRIDINAPYNAETDTVSHSDRLDAHAQTIRELLSRNAKVVLLAHQGRKDRDDFTHLEQHAAMLSEVVGHEISFVADVVGDTAKQTVLSLHAGAAVLLDNVRLLDDETKSLSAREHASSDIVTALAPLADLFVNDAFSASHRSHASVVGFTSVLPSYAGRLLAQEVSGAETALDPDGRTVFVVGGNKIDDVLSVLEHLLQSQENGISSVLTGGVIANVFLAARGYDIGKTNRETIAELSADAIDTATRLLEEAGDAIITPVDVAVKGYTRDEFSVQTLPTPHPIWDIGEETIALYKQYIRNANAVIYKGPMGLYEEEAFAAGTQEILTCISRADGFSMLGGGNTLDMVRQIEVEKADFSHVSLAGGALIAFLAGEELPGVAALET